MRHPHPENYATLMNSIAIIGNEHSMHKGGLAIAQGINKIGGLAIAQGINKIGGLAIAQGINKIGGLSHHIFSSGAYAYFRPAIWQAQF